MKTILKKTGIIAAILFTVSTTAQKKTKSFTVTRTIPASAEKVWKVVGEDYGAISNSHPLLASSEYIDGSLKGGEGVERVCYLNETKTKYTKEKQIQYNPKEYSFRAQIFAQDGLPLDAENSFMDYDVDKIDDNTSLLKFHMTFRTQPAFLGALAKGKFKKNIENYAIAIEHHVLTGENVTKENFKEIKKKYNN